MNCNDMIGIRQSFYYTRLIVDQTFQSLFPGTEGVYGIQNLKFHLSCMK